MTKVRQAERLLDRNEVPEKPFEPWQLQLGLVSGTRAAGTVVRLAGVVVVARAASRSGLSTSISFPASDSP